MTHFLRQFFRKVHAFDVIIKKFLAFIIKKFKIKAKLIAKIVQLLFSCFEVINNIRKINNLLLFFGEFC